MISSGGRDCGYMTMTCRSRSAHLGAPTWLRWRIRIAVSKITPTVSRQVFLHVPAVTRGAASVRRRCEARPWSPRACRRTPSSRHPVHSGRMGGVRGRQHIASGYGKRPNRHVSQVNRRSSTQSHSNLGLGVGPEPRRPNGGASVDSGAVVPITVACRCRRACRPGCRLPWDLRRRTSPEWLCSSSARGGPVRRGRTPTRWRGTGVAGA